MDEQPDSITGEHILESVFNLIITATQQIANQSDKTMDEAKDHVADYLEKIINGLRHRESDR